MSRIASRLALATLATALVLAPAALRAQTPTASTSAAPSASHLAAADQLLEVTRTRELMRTTADRILQYQIAQSPELGQFSEIIRKFYTETMDWTVLGPQYARLYADNFSEPELREMAAFYRTPLGAKMLNKLPDVMMQSNTIIEARLQESMPRLMERLQAAGAGAGQGAKPGRP